MINHLSHVAQGAAAEATLESKYVLASVVGTGLYVAYQGLSFARKRDTVGLDIKTFAIGWGIGIAGGLLWRKYGRLG